MKEVVIVEGVRTPYCKAGTEFKDIPAYRLGALLQQELLYRSELPLHEVDEVIWGNIGQPLEAINIARVIALKSGMPETTPAYTVQRNCASGLQAIVSGYQQIVSGAAEVVIAGGVESMSQYPFLFSRDLKTRYEQYSRAKSFSGRIHKLRRLSWKLLQPVVTLKLVLTDYYCGLTMGQTAELLSREYQISREEQDEFALLSHQRAARATEKGAFKDEIVPVFVAPDYRTVSEDNGIRKQQTLEQLAALPPVFDRKYGVVTAGNASQITDGAAVVLLMSEARAKSLGMEPLGYIRSYAFAGVPPAYMGIGPAYATALALRNAGMKYYDIQLTELNEAFAAVVIANERLFANPEFAENEFGDRELLSGIDREKLNVNGGAIALGHPVGSTATRLVITLLKEMRRRNLTTGLATLCIGGGQGGAIILERK